MRAQLLAAIRAFFEAKRVMEVETPLLCHATGTDPQLDFFTTEFNLSPQREKLFLQTSPEFAMKRLLAAGSGSIYQICKAFRNGELGRYHNPEFTILEWYREHFSLDDLMDEVAELLLQLTQPYLQLSLVEKISYQQVFKQKTGLDALQFDQRAYQQFAEQNQFPDAISICQDDHALWLDFIFSVSVQPALGADSICLIYGYPAVQSSLARINSENPLVSERFEVFINGVELGNGFFELADAVEQERRFDQEIENRRLHGLPDVNKDTLFLSALKAGLPDCSGVAIGLDRLLMLLAGIDSIEQVLSFSVRRA